jgi:hypothetical protein
MAFWKCVTVCKPKPPCHKPKPHCHKPPKHDCHKPKCDVKNDCGYKHDYGCEVKIPCHPSFSDGGLA